MNFQKRENPAGRLGISESVHIDTANTKKNTTKKKKPPTKAEASMEAFVKFGSLNTFEANAAYNDTCLHSCVSYLNKFFGFEFNRKFENVGAKRPVKRYTPTDINEMKRVLNNLRVARGAEVIDA
jgi:hypothetical protein